MQSRDSSLFPFHPFQMAALFSACFAVVLGLLPTLSPLFPYAYSETDALHLLYAQGFFHTDPWGAHSQPIIPWANLHPTVLATLELAKTLPVGLNWLALWMAQTLIAGLFFYRLAAWLRQWLSASMALTTLILTFAHPAVWITLLYSPVNTLTAWLFFEALSRFQKPGFRRLTVALAALSFCGAMGALFALSLCAAITANGWKSESAQRRALFAWLALTPAAMWIAAESLRWGALGGPALVDHPTVYSSVSLTPLFGGLWGETVREALVWLGHGGVDIPFSLPFVGVLALLGGFATLYGSHDTSAIAYAGFSAALFFLFFGAFLPVDLVRQQALPILILTLTFTVIGVARATEPLGGWACSSRVFAMLAALAALILASPFAFQPSWEEARHRHGIAASIDELMSDISNDARVSILFSPIQFAALDEWERINPLGLRIAAPSQTPTGRRSGFVHRAENQSLIILYPSMLQARRGVSAIEAIQNRMAFELCDDAIITYIRNLTLIHIPQSERDTCISGSSRFYESLEPRGDEPSDFAAMSPRTESSEIVGSGWDFESGYDNVSQVGTAFGFSPTAYSSAKGLQSAGPPPGTNRPGLGTLESIPFTLEGEELRFWANMPVSSTATYFALAIHSEATIGIDQPTRRAEHLYHYQPGRALMGDVFYYIRPRELEYGPDRVRGWRVVRLIQGGETNGWRPHRWSTDAWRGEQAIWIAADRAGRDAMWIDGIEQRLRPDGLYWNFEDGTYNGWSVEGEAFGDSPAIGPYGAQQPIEEFEGNYFVNSFYEGSDEAHGRLTSEPFILKFDRMRFLVGGGNDSERLYIGLRVDGEIVFRATGDRSEILEEKEWDLTPWLGSEVQIEIVDASSEPWGHILVDDIRLDSRGRQESEGSE